MPETVVILSPIKPRTPAKITQRFMSWLATCIPAAEEAGYECVVCLDITGDGDKGKVPHHERSRRIADVRNRMLTEFALPRQNLASEWVIWLDSDIVDSTSRTLIPDLITLARGHTAVVAPAVFLESRDCGHNPVSPRSLEYVRLCFYDTAGFVHGDTKASPHYPWAGGAEVQPNVMSLDGSVGCCLCSSGQLYVDGGRFGAPENPAFTEHYPFCQHAMSLGYKLLCSYHNPVFHAFLPSYGEAFH